MTTRLRVKTRAFTYPADAESLRLVREAGGLSKVPAGARERVRLKRVRPGDWCDDMPEESVPLRLARGEIERVPVEAEVSQRGRRRSTGRAGEDA